MRKRSKKSLTPEQRRERAEALHQGLAAQVENLRTSDGWLAYLRFMRGRHDYSLRNQLLIAMQRPEATIVAARSYWWEHGYRIAKGEKQIQILGFSQRKLTEKERESVPEDQQDQKVTYFPVVGVWDLSQMVPRDGVEVTPVDQIAGLKLTQHDDAGVFAILEQVAQSLGVPVTRQQLRGGVGGYFSPSNGNIVLDETRSPAEHARILAHELAHSILHRDIDDYQLHRGRYEVEADSVAYVVAGSLGLDVAESSLPYLAGWSSQDPQLVETASENVHRACREIFAIVDKIEQPEDALAAAS